MMIKMYLNNKKIKCFLENGYKNIYICKTKYFDRLIKLYNKNRKIKVECENENYQAVITMLNIYQEYHKTNSYIEFELRRI